LEAIVTLSVGPYVKVDMAPPSLLLRMAPDPGGVNEF
jgi:hypothetical protein